MQILEVQHAELSYLGTFARPAFPLWANVPGMMSGLYEAFDGLHPGLGALTIEGEARDPLGRTVAVALGTQGVFRVGYDRVEAVLPEYTPDDLAAFPLTLARGDWWLRSQWPDVVYAGHYITFSIHGALSGGSTSDYLGSLSSVELTGFGQSLGTGLIFHAAFPGTNWELHFTVDHSSVVGGGLFVQYVVTIGDDHIAHGSVLEVCNQVLCKAANSVRLVIGSGAVG